MELGILSQETHRYPQAKIKSLVILRKITPSV